MRSKLDPEMLAAWLHQGWLLEVPPALDAAPAARSAISATESRFWLGGFGPKVDGGAGAGVGAAGRR
ncbi:MAG: hypothetical protein RBT63_10225 [Bdellovibrionales bacterium]|nr:hypothetical protein [Bdellovibrionales bacterium]